MTQRYAIYFAPPAASRLAFAAEAWLAQPDIATDTVSARRYGFHATLKAPMRLAAETDRPGLETALRRFARETGPVELGPLAVRSIDGFLALVPVVQSAALTQFAAEIVTAFEPFRAPMTKHEKARRLEAKLTPRQEVLVEQYGYPYTHEEFRFHMTLTDRLDAATHATLLARAENWFAPVLADPVLLDRLVLFSEPAPGAAFERLAGDHLLAGGG
jgi:2'-5' RNA ligase